MLWKSARFFGNAALVVSNVITPVYDAKKGGNLALFSPALEECPMGCKNKGKIVIIVTTYVG